jgi:hypothetical protein
METKSTEVVVAKFPLGRVFITPGVERELSPVDVIGGLKRHAQGDWGEVPEEDWEENEHSLKEGFRLLSSYRGATGTRFWIITEHDRSVTTVLLPEEY